MRKTREILRLKWELRLSHRDAARSVGVSPTTVDNVLSRAAKACLSDWAAVEPLSEDELEARLYERPQARVPSEPRCGQGPYGGFICTSDANECRVNEDCFDKQNNSSAIGEGGHLVCEWIFCD